MDSTQSGPGRGNRVSGRTRPLQSPSRFPRSAHARTLGGCGHVRTPTPFVLCSLRFKRVNEENGGGRMGGGRGGGRRERKENRRRESLSGLAFTVSTLDVFSTV